MNPYESFVQDLTRLVERARAYPLGGCTPVRRPPAQPAAPRALIFSPHPDDEVIIGGLPLRLARESGWRVINVAVTQGSNRARQQERWQELRACCDYIGFELEATAPNGLEGIHPQRRLSDPAAWQHSVQRIVDVLERHRPHAIFFPHDDDWNVTHIGTHHLLADALARTAKEFACVTVETEFWGAMKTPNLLVETSERDLVDLITALSFHVGEVRRNPYHVRLPAWMMDNVRRGGELVGGQGAAAPAFAFGTLYRLRRWKEGAFTSVLSAGRFVGQGDKLETLFPHA
ncbi:MAG TPA: PIG-L family deacetylase [Candidatus Saccharimonadales bacterium]|nr:PIG-L family deacetylase [Candidatus Saccharimonadales bacterium]